MKGVGKAMGVKKVKTTTEELIEPSDAEIVDADPVISPSEAELAEYFDRIGSSANKIKIYKIVAGEKQWCGTMEPGLINEEMLASNYGAGTYQLMAFYNGKYVSGGNQRLTIYSAPNQPGNTAQNAAQMQTNSVETLMREQISRMQELMLALVAQKQSPQGPGLADMASLLQTLQNMTPKQPSITDILPNVLDMFKMSMDTARESTGDHKTDWMDFTGKIIDKLPGIIGQIIPARAAAARAGSPANPPGGEAVESPETQILTQSIAYLKQKCLARKNPDIIVDYIADNLDDSTYREMVGIMMGRPFESFFEIDADLAREPFRGWFKAVYDGLKEALNPNEENTNDAGPVGGTPNP
jgi:hypothetical protein